LADLLDGSRATRRVAAGEYYPRSRFGQGFCVFEAEPTGAGDDGGATV
jgi:hypothetical protein